MCNKTTKELGVIMSALNSLTETERLEFQGLYTNNLELEVIGSQPITSDSTHVEEADAATICLTYSDISALDKLMRDTGGAYAIAGIKPGKRPPYTYR